MADDLDSQVNTVIVRPKRWAYWRLLFLLGFLILGVLVASSVYIAMHSHKQQEDQDNLRIGCEQRLRVLQEELWVLNNFSDAFVALRKSSPTFARLNASDSPAVDQTTWEGFYQSALLGNRFLSHEVWYEYISNASRPSLERAIGGPLRQYCCSKEGADGEALVTREPADEYAVLTMAAGFSAPFGLDLYSMPDKLGPVYLARDSGVPFYTPPLEGLAGQRVFVSFTPAYSLTEAQGQTVAPEQRRAALLGYLGTLVNMSNLVMSVNQRLNSPRFVFRLFDMSPDILQPTEAPLFNEFDDELGPYHGRYDIILPADLGGGRKYEVRCMYANKGGNINEPLLWGGLTFIILILIGLLLYGAFMHMLIMERTHEFLEVMEDDKNVAEEMAKQKREEATAKMEFIANVGYETQRPIERLAQMTRALMQTPLDGTQLGYVQALRASADVLSSFMGDIHDFARIEEGRLELEKVPFEVRNIVDEVMSVFASKAQAAGLELAALVSEKVPSKPLLGDPLRLRQVLMNLVSNAIKFTHEGHVFVRIDVMRSDLPATSPPASSEGTLQGPHHLIAIPSADSPSLSGVISPRNILVGSRSPRSAGKGERSGDYHWPSTPEIMWQEEEETVVLEFEVEDTGVGLSLDAQKNLFQPFSRGTQFLAQRCYGGGMGLSICHRLVQLWSGALSVSSQMGSGSTFRFTVPLVHAPASTSKLPKAYNPFELPALKGQRALVLAEREFPRLVAAAQLRRHGLLVDAVADEKGALDSVLAALGSAEKGGYRCVLVDMEKGADEAHRVAATLRCMPHLRKVPLVLLTSARGPTLEALASLQEYTAVLQKPLRHATVAACMSQVLNVDMPNAALNLHSGEPTNAEAAPASPASPRGLMSLRSVLAGRKITIVEDNFHSRRAAAQLLESLGCQVEYTGPPPQQQSAPPAPSPHQTPPRHPSSNGSPTLLGRPPRSKPLPSWVTPLNPASPPPIYSPNFDVLFAPDSTPSLRSLGQDIRTTGHPVSQL